MSRLQSELNQFLPNLSVSVNTDANPWASCTGASLYASALSEGQWISQAEYQEYGGNIVHYK